MVKVRINRQDREEDCARAQIVTSLVAAALDLPAGQVHSDSRGRPESAARAVVYYVLRSAFGMSLGRVGYAMRRDRSTVGTACGRIEERREDPHFDLWLTALERAVVASPLPMSRAERAA